MKRCLNHRCLEHSDSIQPNGCTEFGDLKDCDCAITTKKDAVADVPCNDGLSVLLQDAQDQRRWFEENIKEKGMSGETKHYRLGSRDAYSYMVSAIIEAINR